jgi:hypothetical protein
VAEVNETEYMTRTVREVMTSGLRSFSESENIGSLMDFFNEDARTAAVVVREGKPVGIVTCNCLVALSRPVTSGSLAAASKYCDTSEYLLVPDIRPLEAEPASTP